MSLPGESIIISGPAFIRPSQVEQAIADDKSAADVAKLAQAMSRDFLRALSPHDSFYYPNIPEFPSIPREVGTAAGEARVVWDIFDAESEGRIALDSLAIFVAAATISRTDQLRGKRHGLVKKSTRLSDGTAVAPHRYLCAEVIPGYLNDLAGLMGIDPEEESIL